MTDRETVIRYSVSYRDHWYRRRHYAGAYFVRDEAMRTADFLALNGRRRVRVEVQPEHNTGTSHQS